MSQSDTVAPVNPADEYAAPAQTFYESLALQGKPQRAPHINIDDRTMWVTQDCLMDYDNDKTGDF